MGRGWEGSASSPAWKTSPKSSPISIQAALALVFMPGWSSQQQRAKNWVRASIRAGRAGEAGAGGSDLPQLQTTGLGRTPTPAPGGSAAGAAHRHTSGVCGRAAPGARCQSHTGTPCSARGCEANPQPGPALCTAPAALSSPNPRLEVLPGPGVPQIPQQGARTRTAPTEHPQGSAGLAHRCAGGISPLLVPKAL